MPDLENDYVAYWLGNHVVFKITGAEDSPAEDSTLIAFGALFSLASLCPRKIDDTLYLHVSLRQLPSPAAGWIDSDLSIFWSGNKALKHDFSVISAKDLSTEAREKLIRYVEFLPPEVGTELKYLFSALTAQYHGGLYAIDLAETHQGFLFVSGWLENASSEKIHILPPSLAGHGTPDCVYYVNRVDVSKVLTESAKSISDHRHGFSCAFPIRGAEPQFCSMYVERGGDLLHVGDFPVSAMQTPNERLGHYWRTHSSVAIPPVPFIRNIARPLLASPIPEPLYNAFSFGPALQRARATIIVPLFKEWFFLRSILAMQKNFSADLEWIIVCDDPTIATDVGRFMMSRSTSVARPTTLVVNERNYGYSTANNIGVSLSRSEVCVFMNSDIWIENTSGFEIGISKVLSGEYSLLGFRLLFEDGSLQHDGMTFRREREFANLFLAEHESKGLPPRPVDSVLSDALAVTGALMMVGKSKFLELGGFDPNYLRGDFEDADLCLRFSERGEKVGIIRDGACFHLERQSIRKMADADFRTCVTLVNCVYFNDKWASFLEQRQS